MQKLAELARSQLVAVNLAEIALEPAGARVAHVVRELGDLAPSLVGVAVPYRALEVQPGNIAGNGDHFGQLLQLPVAEIAFTLCQQRRPDEDLRDRGAEHLHVRTEALVDDLAGVQVAQDPLNRRILDTLALLVESLECLLLSLRECSTAPRDQREFAPLDGEMIEAFSARQVEKLPARVRRWQGSIFVLELLEEIGCLATVFCDSCQGSEKCNSKNRLSHRTTYILIQHILFLTSKVRD